MKNIFLLFILSGSLAQAHVFDSLQSKAEAATTGWACENPQSALFDIVYAALIDLKKVPTHQELTLLFESVIKRKSQSLEQSQFLQLVDEFYSLILSQPHDSPQALLQKVTAAEVGDRTTPEAEKLQESLQSLNLRWQDFLQKNQGSCPHPKQTSGPPQSELRSISFGANKTLAVAYQSCESAQKVPMSAQTGDALGISIVGTHPDGVGRKRKITDLPALLGTDYYLENFQVGESCKDVRKHPLIYDYGGKPSTPSVGSIMDLFTDAGDGTSELGIDCSGFVFTSIATTGLKLDPNKKLKPVLVHGINAVMYKEPARNGMPCFEKIKVGVGGTLREGDVAAKSGHVVVISSVGRDPLGIFQARTPAECDQITSQNFDFAVAQSSPSKNGIGINKFFARDYLPESPGMKAGFEIYARRACRARLEGQDVLVSGEMVQIVRHKMTSACADQPVSLVGEACVSKCLN